MKCFTPAPRLGHPGTWRGAALRSRAGGLFLALGLAGCLARPPAGPRAVVFQTDFGLKDGAVAAMKGVATGVDPSLRLHDLTQEIPPFHIWEAAYRLKQTFAYWPPGTVFVSVVDPGVGTERRPVVARLRTGQWVVTPDNGTLTFLAESPGIESLRVIDMARHRLPGSADSYTFHGRDLFAYVAARLAAGKLSWAGVGEPAATPAVRLPYQAAELRDGVLLGTVPVLDIQYGNVWSNIPGRRLAELGVKPGDSAEVTFRQAGREVWRGTLPLVTTFGAVPAGQPLLFVNSLLDVAVALNQDSFAARHGIGSGPDWTLEVRPAPRP
ncbi:MAG: S-adenosyl-l-methionine hydroxide adenosyltransferase family protein [Verrucomicrobiota bacterium]